MAKSPVPSKPSRHIAAIEDPQLTLAEKLALFDPQIHGGEAMVTVPIGIEVLRDANPQTPNKQMRAQLNAAYKDGMSATERRVMKRMKAKSAATLKDRR